MQTPEIPLRPPPPEPTPGGYVPRYVSPHGFARGLPARLAEWAQRMGADRSLPWAGLGICEDMKLAAAILNKREWLEAMRLSDDPKAQEFAAELLDDDETLDAAWNAAEHARALPKGTDTLDLVAVTEALDAAALQAQATNRSIRLVLEQAGVADDQTTDDELPDLLRALLA